MGYPSYDHPTPERPRRWVSNETIDNWTAYHPPTGGKVRLHEAIRHQFNETLMWLNNVLPEGPDKTNALQACRHAMNAANTAVACNPLEPEIDKFFTFDNATERVQTILGVDDRQRIEPPDDNATQTIPAVAPDGSYVDRIVG